MSVLTPSLLLYRAAAAHNLPVMCQALALRADVLIPHPQPAHHARTPLHAAVLSVSKYCRILIHSAFDIFHKLRWQHKKIISAVFLNMHPSVDLAPKVFLTPKVFSWQKKGKVKMKKIIEMLRLKFFLVLYVM